MKLPRHISLSISHNPHLLNYESVAQYLDHNERVESDYNTPADRQRCIDTNELWECIWYVDTPIGYQIVTGAPSYECLLIALEKAANKPKEA